jgi:hypothetical protein
LKNRKEYVLFENEKGRIWRISKRLCRINKGKSLRYVARVLDLHIFKDSFFFKWSNIGESISQRRKASFKIKNGKIISYITRGLGTNGTVPVRCTYEPLLTMSDLKKGINAKINRILNKEYGLKFKIGVPFYKNVIRMNFPHYVDLYPKPTLDMARVITKPSVKKSIKSYCGFSGKKFLADILAESEARQRAKLDVIRMLRKHLTFGEIDVPNIQILYTSINKIAGLKELIPLNPSLFKRGFLKKENVAQIWTRQFTILLPDIVRMYQQIAGVIDIESTPLALAKAKKIHEYHNALSAYHRKMEHENFPFKEYDFHDSKAGEFTIKVCKDCHELIEWSTYMSNCVTSYRSRILGGEIVMCGLFKGGTLIYNLSLKKVGKKFTIDQLNSRYNRGYDAGDFALIESFISEIKNVLPRQKETASA